MSDALPGTPVRTTPQKRDVPSAPEGLGADGVDAWLDLVT
jgi:hypothetical protein